MNLRLQIAIFVFICGCDADDPHTPTLPPPLPSAAVSVPSLLDGPRPSSINGANVRDIHDFHQNHPPAGFRVCIEGRFLRRESQMGVDYFIMQCPTCETEVWCNGASLRALDIAPRTRVLLCGQMPLANGPIEQCQLVGQSEIDKAIAHGANAAQK